MKPFRAARETYVVNKPKRQKKKVKLDHSLGERWTPLIATKGFTPVPTAFLEHYTELSITPSEAMLLVHLASFKWTSEAPFPALPRLARMMGCTVRYVRKMCASLESVGYLTRTQRKGTSNLFHLNGLFAKLEDIINANRAASPPEAAETPPAGASPQASAPMVAFPPVMPSSLLPGRARVVRETVPQPLRRSVRTAVSLPGVTPSAVPPPASSGDTPVAVSPQASGAGHPMVLQGVDQ
jgi:hypothetical protein